MLAQERQSQGSLISNYSTFLTFHVKNMRKKIRFYKKNGFKFNVLFAYFGFAKRTTKERPSKFFP